MLLKKGGFVEGLFVCFGFVWGFFASEDYRNNALFIANKTKSNHH